MPGVFQVHNKSFGGFEAPGACETLFLSFFSFSFLKVFKMPQHAMMHDSFYNICDRMS